MAIGVDFLRPHQTLQRRIERMPYGKKCVIGFITIICIALTLVVDSKFSLAVPIQDFDPGNVLQVQPGDVLKAPERIPLSEALDLLNTGKFDEAIDKVKTALAKNPNSAPAHEILGAALIMRGEVDTGFEELKKAVKLDPKQSSAITKMGEVYMAKKDSKSAKESFLKAVQITPNDRRAHQRLGILYEQEGEREFAITHFEKGILGTPPGYVGVKVNLAGLYNEARRFDKAVKLLEEIPVDQISKNATALIVLGTAYIGLNKTDEAIRAFETAKKLEPDTERAALSLGIAYRQKGLYAASKKELEQVVKIKPKWYTGHFQMGETLFSMKEYDKALASYGQAEKLSPNNRMIKERIAKVYLAQERVPEAITIYQEFTQSKSADPRDYDMLGTAYQISGQLGAAEETFTQMRQKFPKNSFSFYRSGLFYGFLKDYDQAILQFSQALLLEPKNCSVLKALSVAYNQQGEKEKALNTARKIVEIRPDSAEDQFYLATLYQDEGRNMEAIQLYKTVILQSPEHILSHNNLAVLLLEEGKSKEAQELAEKAALLAPENPMVLDTLGWILYKNKDYVRALETLNKAASLMSTNPVILYHLGAAQHASGSLTAARQNLERALRISQEFKGAEEARKLLDQ